MFLLAFALLLASAADGVFAAADGAVGAVADSADGAAAIAARASATLPPPPASCKGQINSRPLSLGDDVPIVNTTSNGSTKRVVTANLSAPLLLVHAYGSIYEMHAAVGELLRDEIAASVPASLAYLYAQVNASYNLSWLPEPVRDWVVEYGVETALDWTANATAPYIPAHWTDALRGLADGSGASIVDLRRVAMIAEWTRAQCSMLGAWGAASFTGQLTQLRALDWDTDGPFQQWPTLIVYHPNAASGGVPNAVLGWAGMLGAITGVSSSGVGISEKVWDAYTGLDSAFGYAWNYMLADALMFDKDTDQVLSRIATANRTCSIWIGVGDAHGNGGGGSFKAVAYSFQQVSIYNSVNFPAYVRSCPAHTCLGPRARTHPVPSPAAEPRPVQGSRLHQQARAALERAVHERPHPLHLQQRDGARDAAVHYGARADGRHAHHGHGLWRGPALRCEREPGRWRARVRRDLRRAHNERALGRAAAAAARGAVSRICSTAAASVVACSTHTRAPHSRFHVIAQQNKTFCRPTVKAARLAQSM